MTDNEKAAVDAAIKEVAEVERLREKEDNAAGMIKEALINAYGLVIDDLKRVKGEFMYDEIASHEAKQEAISKVFVTELTLMAALHFLKKPLDKVK